MSGLNNMFSQFENERVDEAFVDVQFDALAATDIRDSHLAIMEGVQTVEPIGTYEYVSESKSKKCGKKKKSKECDDGECDEDKDAKKGDPDGDTTDDMDYGSNSDSGDDDSEKKKPKGDGKKKSKKDDDDEDVEKDVEEAASCFGLEGYLDIAMESPESFAVSDEKNAGEMQDNKHQRDNGMPGVKENPSGGSTSTSKKASDLDSASEGYINEDNLAEESAKLDAALKDIQEECDVSSAKKCVSEFWVRTSDPDSEEARVAMESMLDAIDLMIPDYAV